MRENSVNRSSQTPDEWLNLEDDSWVQIFVDLSTTGVSGTREYYQKQASYEGVKISDTEMNAALKIVCERVLSIRLGKDLGGVPVSKSDHESAEQSVKIINRGGLTEKTKSAIRLWKISGDVLKTSLFLYIFVSVLGAPVFEVEKAEDGGPSKICILLEK